MKKYWAVPAACFLLSFLLTGCVEGGGDTGPTINDMVMPSGSAAASPAASPAAGVTAVRGTASAGGANTAGAATASPKDNAVRRALSSCPVPESYRIDISMELDEAFKQGPNTFVVPFELKGRIQTLLHPQAKMDIRVNSRASFASEDVDYAAQVYMEKTGSGWVSYSNESGEWVRTVRNDANVAGFTLTEKDWDALAASVRDVKAAGYEDVNGVRAAKTEATVPAKMVYALFGAQLSYVIPGMQTAPLSDKASDESIGMTVLTGEDKKLLELRFDAGTAWEELVGDSFAARSTDAFAISAQNVQIRLSVSEPDAVEPFSVPQKALNAIGTSEQTPLRSVAPPLPRKAALCVVFRVGLRKIVWEASQEVLGKGFAGAVWAGYAGLFRRGFVGTVGMKKASENRGKP